MNAIISDRGRVVAAASAMATRRHRPVSPPACGAGRINSSPGNIPSSNSGRTWSASWLSYGAVRVQYVFLSRQGDCHPLRPGMTTRRFSYQSPNSTIDSPAANMVATLGQARANTIFNRAFVTLPRSARRVVVAAPAVAPDRRSHCPC